MDIHSVIRAATLSCILFSPASALPQSTNTSQEIKADPVNQ